MIRGLRQDVVDLVGNGSSKGSPKDAFTHGNTDGPKGGRQGSDDLITVHSKEWKDVPAGYRRFGKCTGLYRSSLQLRKIFHRAVAVKRAHNGKLNFRISLLVL